MNTQIIEEKKNQMIVKCFKINELSIEECLKSMHFLSLNMFEEILDKKKANKEIRDNITKFYYMLVMQVRRFLEEGKFAEENQISLTRAMDMRMAAEKVQRISEIIENLKLNETNAGEVEDYYSDAFNSFIKEDFEKAVSVWNRYQNLQKKTKNQDLSKILRYSKEISMLVR
jgi:phosphate uptake regulator